MHKSRALGYISLRPRPEFEAKHHQQFETRLKTGDFFLFPSPAVQLMASELFRAQPEIKDVVLSRAFGIKDGY